MDEPDTQVLADFRGMIGQKVEWAEHSYSHTEKREKWSVFKKVESHRHESDYAGIVRAGFAMDRDRGGYGDKVKTFLVIELTHAEFCEGRIQTIDADASYIKIVHEEKESYDAGVYRTDPND